MKKNMLSILILALLIVNIVLTSVMMVGVMGTNKKTAKLVGDIATVLNFEISTPGEEAPKEEVSLADTVIHDMAGTMTVPLKDGGYMIFSVSIFMNSKHEDFKTYGEDISSKESLIKNEINTVVTERTESQCRNDYEGIKQDILEAIQKKFKSDFIYNIAINDIKFGS